jgi:hypothetical protein
VVTPPVPAGPADGLTRADVRGLVAALARQGVTATCSLADGPRYGAIEIDSNLPDFRVCLGGPDVSSFAAAVLAAAGPGPAAQLAAQLSATGTARVWVPAARSRADAFGDRADLRAPGDLPVLIVAGVGPGELAAAVTALVQDLADAVVDADDDEAEPAPSAGYETRPVPVPLADRSVALLNRGTPGCVVTSDGTLYMSLMRSCSAWPSGIWIDGDRRVAPDGSSFAWQHWSHTFEYALASGQGDWRTAGFNAAAEEYNHDLLAVVTGPQAASAASLLSVTPANVMVSAVKPRGNPLASGRSGALAGGPAGVGAPGEGVGAPGEQAEVTVRLRETSGQATTARLRLATGVSAAWLTNLLEESDGVPLRVEDSDGGTVIVDMSAFETVTLVVRTGARPAADGHPASAEPVQPVYARYWLHGKGPAPAGNLPVAVHLSPTRIALTESGASGMLTLTVGGGAEPASGKVELDVPSGVTVGGADDLRYALTPGGYAAWDLTVRADAATAAGRYFMAARIRDELGYLIEDTAMVAVGERRWPDLDLPPEETLELLQADYRAGAAEVELSVLTPELSVAPGEEAELVVRVTNRLASELRGEAQLVSPFGTWPLLGSWTQGFGAAPQVSVPLRFPVKVPVTERPGSRWWALVKVMYFGRVRYTEAIPVIIKPR